MEPAVTENKNVLVASQTVGSVQFHTDEHVNCSLCVASVYCAQETSVCYNHEAYV